jgi:phospholipase C
MGRSTRLAVLAIAGVVTLAPPAAAHGAGGGGSKPLAKIDHFVVIYQENHSFDNLYGGWEGVDGLASADAAHTTQVSQTGAAYECLLQNDVNLTSPPLSATCTNTAPPFSSHFANAPFRIEDHIAPADTTTASTRSSTSSTAGARTAT